MFPMNMDAEWWDEEEDNLRNNIDNFWAEDNAELHQLFESNLHDAHSFISNSNLHESQPSSSPVFTLQKDVAPLGLTRTPSPPPPPPPPLPVLTGPITNVETQPEKPKASKFCISAIKIGRWQRESRREGDLIAKIYYSRKKLLWEVLDGMEKKKMEIPWSDITAIGAVMQQNQPGILQIELEKPPSFFLEIPPQPTKHTNWDPTTDFTRGQALQHRKHIVMFPPGVLDEHYEKLIQYDKHLYELSRKPFPSQESPAQSFNFDGPGPGYKPAVAHPTTPILAPPSPANFNGLRPTHVPPLAQHYVAHPTTPILSLPSPATAVNSLNRYEGVINYQVMGHAQSKIRGDSYFVSPPPRNQYQGFPAANKYLLNNYVPLNTINKEASQRVFDGSSSMHQMGGLSFINSLNNNNMIIKGFMSSEQMMRRMQNALGNDNSMPPSEPSDEPSDDNLDNMNLFPTFYPNH